MKRHLIFCIALVAVMVSCVKEPQIYHRLTDEEAAIVPYQLGQTIRMLNQDNDTLCFTVVHDTTYVAHNYDDSRYHPYGKMSIEPRPYFYAREVVLQSPPEEPGHHHIHDWGNHLRGCACRPRVLYGRHHHDFLRMVLQRTTRVDCGETWRLLADTDTIINYSSFAHPYGMQKVDVVCFTDSKSLRD